MRPVPRALVAVVALAAGLGLDAVTALVASRPAAAQPSGADADRRARAFAFLKEGQARYDLGRFEQAIELFERAYEIHPFPEALFNLGQAHRQLARPERAVFYFRAYLRNQPGAANRDQVERLIVELEARRGEGPSSRPSGPPTSRPTGPPTSKPTGTAAPGATSSPAAVATGGPSTDVVTRPWYADGWGWALAGVGVGAAAATVVLLVAAERLEDDAAGATDQADAANLYDRARGRRIGGLATGAVALGGLVGGGVRLALTPAPARPQRPRPAARAAIVVWPAWVGVAGTF